MVRSGPPVGGVPRPLQAYELDRPTDHQPVETTTVRIIAGTARGVPLRVPRGMRVRPTSGRVRTSLFSILGPEVEGARVLDLFAGSGALGIEALSRGAERCCFVESSRAALAALEDNLARSRLATAATRLACDAFQALPLLAANGPFDLALIDPPYALLRQRPRDFLSLVQSLAADAVLAADALAVVQHDSQTPLPQDVGPLVTTDTRAYGTTTLTFLERPPATAMPADD